MRVKGNAYENQQISVTMSFGLAMYKQKERIDDLIKKADEKLYEAKNNGRDQIRQLKNIVISYLVF